MIGVIVASRKVGINPDNVATPIAASLGDLITLSLLAGISTGLYKELGKHTRSVPLICNFTGPSVASAFIEEVYNIISLI